jgi:pimeloyl-ACP methyl ester carboxylesterase
MPTGVIGRIETEVGELEVRVHGAGPVAVLWHSLFVDDRSWDRVAPALAGARRLVRITGPGHGGSAATARSYTLDDCAAAALTVLDALGLAGPVDWVGSAWGGHVGLVLAATHPERVRTLAAFNAPVAALTAVESRAPRLLATVFGLLGAVTPVRRGVITALLSERTRAADPEAVAYVEGCLQSAPRRALVTAIRSVSLTRPDLTPLLPRIATPSLLVTGPDDPMWTPDQARRAAAAMPHGDAAIVAGSGHLTPFETPGETISLMMRLWADA